MYLAFYRNRKSQKISSVQEIPAENLDDFANRAIEFNLDFKNKNTVTVKKLTECEEYLYKRGECHVSDFKDELRDIENSFDSLEGTVRSLVAMAERGGNE